MPNEEKAHGKSDAAPGQARMHMVYDAAGNVVPSPSGAPEWTQDEWRARDKDAGYTRAAGSDDDDAE